MRFYISKVGVRVIETEEYFYFFPVDVMLTWNTLARGIEKGFYHPQPKELFQDIVDNMEEFLVQ